jgi:hypothetical protein
LAWQLESSCRFKRVESRPSNERASLFGAVAGLASRPATSVTAAARKRVAGRCIVGYCRGYVKKVVEASTLGEEEVILEYPGWCKRCLTAL